MSPPTILLTNDDGPPCDSSPFIFDFVQVLARQLGWNDVRVVIPSGQRSWIGKAFMIKETCSLSYLYLDQDGKEGERSSNRIEGRSPEWILLDGTPATCSNVAIHNLYPGQIDLCISGPNYGRNTSSAFALSSGTIGAALASSLCAIPSIALSYGIFEKPIDPAIIDRAHASAATVISRLWQAGFPGSSDRPAVYNVNVPLVPALLEGEMPPVRFTTMAERVYGRLFTPIEVERSEKQREAGRAGPSAVAKGADDDEGASSKHHARVGEEVQFKFAPDISALINPDPSSLIEGTDIHAIQNGAISVTPLKALFASADIPSGLEAHADSAGRWKL